MKLLAILTGTLAVLTVSSVTDAAQAASRYHHARAHHGYGAYAQYRGHRPTGPSNLNFEMGSGWNNGSPGHPQYGNPDHN